MEPSVGVLTAMNTSGSSTTSDVLKKSTTANLPFGGKKMNGSQNSLGRVSQRVKVKRKHLKERSSPFEGGQRSPREDTENIPPALPATLPKDYEEISQRLAGSFHSGMKDVCGHQNDVASLHAPDTRTNETSQFDPTRHNLHPKLSKESSSAFDREPGQVSFKLKQGTATHSNVYTPSADSASDVRVTQFVAGQKKKVMKESLSKRSEQMGPVRRVFEPRYVGTASSDQTNRATHVRDDISQMAVSTAAAVAATAPLIKYQHDLENKVSLILEKLQHLESDSTKSRDRGQHLEVASEQLERRLDELTQVKLRELEKLQFQQHQLVSHSKPPLHSSSTERKEDQRHEPWNHTHFPAGIRKEKLPPESYANTLRKTTSEGGMTIASQNSVSRGLPMGHPEPLRDMLRPNGLKERPLQAMKHVRYAPAVHFHEGPRENVYIQSADVNCQKDEILDSKEGIGGLQTSPLDTPAPRKYAPVPHTKSTRTRPNGGLLEEILSSQGEATRRKSPDSSFVEGNSRPSKNFTTLEERGPTLEERGLHHSQVEKQADTLLTEIASLRKDISKKIKGRKSPQATPLKSPKRFSPEPSSSGTFQNQPRRVTPEIRKDAERELQRWQEKRLAPPPLDEYMRKPFPPPSMATPSSRPNHPSYFAETHLHTSRAPVQSSSAIVQAETLLKRVQISRKYLESNLQVIQRSKREQEFQEVMESMYADGDAAERAQIKLLVDDYIALVDSQVKEELLHYRSNLSFSPPTKLSPEKTSKPSAAEPSKTSKPVKKKISAKIDTGLRKTKETGDGRPIKAGTGTTKETREKPKETKSATGRASSVSSKVHVKHSQDNRYLSSIYGRNLLQQSQRTTLRDAPYLRFANQSPQTKGQRMSPSKDAYKHTTHTQTPGGIADTEVSLLKQFPFQTFPSASKQSQQSTFQNYLDPPEILQETAIPLGEPRVGGERSEPVVIFNQLDIPPSKQVKQNNVAVVSMVTRKPQLEIKHLPSVDIDTEVSSTSEKEDVAADPPSPVKEIETQDLLADQYQEQKVEDADSDKESIPETSGLLSFQGHQDNPREYHGTPFPPQTSTRHHERKSEDVAAELERKGLLEHRAMEWIEQELMAKMISEFHSRLSRPEERTDSPERDEDHSVDAIGSGGLQLFVDAGQPVNPGLVSALVKEVLEEDIAKMLGQHLRDLSAEGSNMPVTHQRPHSQTEEVSHHPLIHTPEVTPTHSPLRSPSPVSHDGPIKTPEPTASDISQEADTESEEKVPDETGNLIQAPTSPVDTPPMTPPPFKDTLTPEPGQVETPTPSFHENPPLLLGDTGTVGTPSLTIEETPPGSPVEKKETPQQSPPPPLSLEPEATPPHTLPPSPPREVTPPLSTQSSSSSTTEDITATETSGREISAGEWLISQQSEGQVPKALMQDTFLDGTSLQGGGEVSQTTSSDTLLGTEELEDEVTQDPIEEGEIRGDAKLEDIRDPMVAILTKLNQLPGGYHLPKQVTQSITRGDPSSPGEISEGQRPVMAPGLGHLEGIGAGDDRNLPQSPGEVSLPKEGDIYDREPGETPRIIAQDKRESPHKDSTLHLSQLNSGSSSSENTEKGLAIKDKRNTLSSEEGTMGQEPVMGLQVTAPRIIQVGAFQPPREEESAKEIDSGDGRHPNPDIFGTHTVSDRDMRPRTLTPDAINMEALLQSGYLSQTFSQSDGGPPMGSLPGQRGTFGENETVDTLQHTGAIGTTLGTTMTEDSLEVTAAKRVPKELQQKKVSITLPSTSNIPEEKLDWSQSESEPGNQTVSDVSEISAGDL